MPTAKEKKTTNTCPTGMTAVSPPRGTVIPEQYAVVLLASGLGGLMVWRWKGRRGER